MNGILQDIGHGLAESCGIEISQEGGGGQGNIELKSRAVGGGHQQGGDLLDQIPEVSWLGPRRLRPGEKGPLLNEVFNFVRLPFDVRQRFQGFAALFRTVRLHELRMHADGGHRIAHLVCQAGGHTTQRGESF